MNRSDRRSMLWVTDPELLFEDSSSFGGLWMMAFTSRGMLRAWYASDPNVETPGRGQMHPGRVGTLRAHCQERRYNGLMIDPVRDPETGDALNATFLVFSRRGLGDDPEDGRTVTYAEALGRAS